MTFHTGHIRDTRRNQPDANRLLGARTVALPAPGTVISLRQFECTTPNQLQCEGCGGHSGGLAIYMDFASQGATLPFVPSFGDLYKLARLVGAPGQPLSDNGVELSNVATAAGVWGIRPIGQLNPGGFTDVTPENVNTPETLADLITDSHRLVIDEYRLDLSASDAIPTLVELLKTTPVQVGGPVGSAYQGYQVGQPAVGPEPDGSGHATVLTGCEVVGTAERAAELGVGVGDVVFEDKTSWGDSFGDHGHLLVTSSWVLSQWDALVWRCRLVAS